MAYLAVNDFKYGMDRRRPRAVGVPGTLWLLRNAVVTRGGDIERAKKFVATHLLPANTFGLAGLRDELYVFGSAETPEGLPGDMRYRQLRAPIPGGPPGSTYAMQRIHDVRVFDGKLYVVAGFVDGSVHHFYDGDRVSDLVDLSADAASYQSVAQRLARLINENPNVEARAIDRFVRVQAKVPGADFTSSANAFGGETPSTFPTATHNVIQPNVTAAPEVKAFGKVTITGGDTGPGNAVTALTVDGVSLIDVEVPWGTSNASTANALAVEINNGASVHGYDATVAGSTVTFTAAVGLGAAANGRVVAVTTSGTVTATKANMAGGVSAVQAMRRLISVGINATTFDGTDRWAITINGITYQTRGWASRMPLTVFPYKQRIWAPIGGLVRYSKLNDPDDWTDADASSGAGFINVSTQTDTTAEMTAMAEYNGKVAIFSRDVIIIYSLAADAQTNQFVQTLNNTGTLAPKSVVTYGATDTYYLDASGVRSLRTRDGYDAAFTTDIGSAIDPYVQYLLGGVDNIEGGRAKSVIESFDGRLMMAMGSQILALSNFPSSKITAWSFFDLEVPIDELLRSGRDLFVRSGDTIYTYGGLDRQTYPNAGEFIVTVETPFVSAQDPAGQKQLQSYDHAATNTWKVEILVNPNDETQTVEVGRLTGTTYNQDAAWVTGNSAVFAVRYTCDAAGFASLSATATHFQAGEKQ